MLDERNNNNTYAFLLGTAIGAAVGAVTALLFAPKSGKELRHDIAEKSSELYGKASDYCVTTSEKVGTAVKNTYNQGMDKAQQYVNTTKEQAANLMNKAGEAYNSVKNQANIVKDAAKEGYNTFKNEVKNAQEA